jgi:O-antigen/teichoic acid export membrane protein
MSGIAASSVLTFAYFSIASHVLGAVGAKRVDLVWSVMFVIVSVIYRPIEQLLARTIADRRARGMAGHPLRVPATIQAGFALLFLTLAVALHPSLAPHAFNGSSTLYWILVTGTLAYAGSYFARGWLAGHQYFGLYSGLVLIEAGARVSFALAVAVGLADGESAVALGIAAAPLLSLAVIPSAAVRERRARAAGLDDAARPAPASHPSAADVEAAIEGPATAGVEEAVADLSMRHGAGFAFAVSAIQLSEQVLLNGAVLIVAATSADRALAGIVFNVLLVARAPLLLFQAIQTSLLPFLAGLEVAERSAAFARSIRVTIAAIGAFTAVAIAALVTIGPFVLGHLFGQHYAYGRFGLGLVGLGLGLHLASGTLNQAALARSRSRAAACCWLLAAAAFLAWMFVGAMSDQVQRFEVGYLGATTVLALALGALYRRGAPAPSRA